MKTKREIKKIVLCVHTSLPADAGWREVDAEARRRGSLRGPYHFLVKRNGEYEEGRPLDMPTPVEGEKVDQARTYLVIGAIVPTGMKFTNPQRDAINALILVARAQFPDAEIDEVVGV